MERGMERDEDYRKGTRTKDLASYENYSLRGESLFR